MAVPKRRTTRASRDKRRSHHALTIPSFVKTKDNKIRLRHFIDPEGMYRGKQIVKKQSK